MPESIKASIDATKVSYKNLGSSGLRVSFPIFGTMGLGSSKWLPSILDEEESILLLKAAYDRGLTTWDTANMYCNGVGEEVIGKAIRQHEIPREKVVLMTKVGITLADDVGVFAPPFNPAMNETKDYVNRGGKSKAFLDNSNISLIFKPGLSRRAIFRAVDASLKRLGTDYIDLLQIHRLDNITPWEETMKALHDLVQMGKVLYIGASTMWASEFIQLQNLAERNGWTKFVSMQNLYHLLYREEEREMIRYCKQTGVGIIPWSSMAGGSLARPLGEEYKSYRSENHGPKLTEADKEIVGRVEEIAKKRGWKMAHVALAWHKAKGSIPIVGFNSTKRMEDAFELMDKELTDDEVKHLEEPYVAKSPQGMNG